MAELGPRKVRGRYHCGYWNEDYIVTHVGHGAESRIGWSDWSITVRWADGHETTHCTAWDPKRDRVL